MLSSSSSAIFWLRILLEAPLVIWGFWYPQSLPFSDMNDTTLVFVKVRDSQYTTAVNLCRFTGLERNELGHVHYFPYVLLSSRQAMSQYSSSLHNDANFLGFSPGKHAVAMGLFFYHTLMSIILVQAPHFISTTSSLETVPKAIWGPLHAIVGLWFGLWWVWGWVNPPEFLPIPILHIYFPLPPPPPPQTQNTHNFQARPQCRWVTLMQKWIGLVEFGPTLHPVQIIQSQWPWVVW